MNFLTLENKQMEAKRRKQRQEERLCELRHVSTFLDKKPLSSQCEPDISKPIFTLLIMSQSFEALSFLHPLKGTAVFSVHISQTKVVQQGKYKRCVVSFSSYSYITVEVWGVFLQLSS